MKNYYELLEVNENASKEIIEKAYRVLVKKYHPDLYSSVQKKEAEEMLKELNEAYKVLSDDFLREQYDKELKKDKEMNKTQQNFNQTYDNNYEQNFEEETKNKKTNKIFRNKEKNKNKNEVGTIFGIAEVVKALFKARPKKGEKKKITRTDLLAVGLTIVALLVIGVILWFIPFTNGWMRQLLFENALFDLIGSLFS